MKKIFLFLTLFSFPIFSSQIEIINLPLAKSISLAKETAVVDNKVFNTLTNPAMLYKVNYGCRLGYNKSFYYANTSYDLIGFSFRRERDTEVINNFSIVFGKFSSGDIKVTNMEGIETGEVVEYKASLISFGSSAKVNYGENYNVFLGISGFYVFEKINVETKYLGGSIGVIYNLNFSNRLFKSLNFGFVVKGLGANKNLLYNGALCLEIPYAKFIFGYENYYPKNIDDKYKFGISITIFGYENYKINLDLGYNLGRYNNSISCGFDLNIKSILLIYSFCQHTYLGNLHNVMLGFKL